MNPATVKLPSFRCAVDVRIYCTVDLLTTYISLGKVAERSLYLKIIQRCALVSCT